MVNWILPASTFVPARRATFSAVKSFLSLAILKARVPASAEARSPLAWRARHVDFQAAVLSVLIDGSQGSKNPIGRRPGLELGPRFGLRQVLSLVIDERLQAAGVAVEHDQPSPGIRHDQSHRRAGKIIERAERIVSAGRRLGDAHALRRDRDGRRCTLRRRAAAAVGRHNPNQHCHNSLHCRHAAFQALSAVFGG